MIGNNLHRYRKANKITQQKLADDLGIERANLSYYENEKNYPSWDLVQKMIEFFEIPHDKVYNFLFGSYEIKPMIRYLYYKTGQNIGFGVCVRGKKKSLEQMFDEKKEELEKNGYTVEVEESDLAAQIERIKNEFAL